MKLSPKQQHALHAMRSAGGTIHSQGTHGVQRITVEALSRRGLCHVRVFMGEREIPTRHGTGTKVVAHWVATITETTQQDHKAHDDAWVVLSTSMVEVARVRGATSTEARASAVALLGQSQQWGLRRLFAHEATAWITDLRAAGDIYRLQEADEGRVSVRHVATGDVVLIRDTLEEAQRDLQREAAALRVALTA